MWDLLILGVLIGLCIIGYALLLAVGPLLLSWVRVTFLASIIVSLLISYFFTFRHSNYSSPDTEILGWPLRFVAATRRDAYAPWIGRGPVKLVAFTLNFVACAVLPSAALLIYRRRLTRHWIEPL